MTAPKRYDDDDIARLAHIMADDIKNEFRVGFEAIDFIKEQVKKIPIIEANIRELQSDMKAVKTLLKLHNQEIAQLQAISHSH